MTRFVGDANILLRLGSPESRDHRLVAGAVQILMLRGDELILTPQAICEAWNVFTRPADKNGFGLSDAETEQRVRGLLRLHSFLPDPSSLFRTWLDLVIRFGVRGVQVHDARLAAACVSHGVTHLLTLNVKDFSRYTGVVTAVHPQDV